MLCPYKAFMLLAIVVIQKLQEGELKKIRFVILSELKAEILQ